MRKDLFFYLDHFRPKKINTKVLPTGTKCICVLYSLRWFPIERYVQVKKLLFIRSIMAMNDDMLSQKLYLFEDVELLKMILVWWRLKQTHFRLFNLSVEGYTMFKRGHLQNTCTILCFREPRQSLDSSC